MINVRCHLKYVPKGKILILFKMKITKFEDSSERNSNPKKYGGMMREFHPKRGETKYFEGEMYYVCSCPSYVSLSRTHIYEEENQISEQQAVTIDNKLTHLQTGHKMAHTLSQYLPNT